MDIDLINKYINQNTLDIVDFSNLTKIRGVSTRSCGHGITVEYMKVFYNKKFVGEIELSYR